MPRPCRPARTSCAVSTTAVVRRFGHRVEVEVQVVGPIDVVAARVPRVEVDAAEVDEPEQRRQVLDDREVDHAARAVRDRAGLDPRRPRRRRALHEERLAVGAVGIALHHHRAVGEVRQQHRRDVGVVLEQVALGDAERGPERLVEVGELDLARRRSRRAPPCPRGSATRPARCAPCARRDAFAAGVARRHRRLTRRRDGARSRADAGCSRCSQT